MVYPVMMEEIRRRYRGCSEMVTETENWSEGRSPSIDEIVSFIESLAESDKLLEITDVSSGWIRFTRFAITAKPRSSFDRRVDTYESSEETPPPLRQLMTAEDTARLGNRRGDDGGGWWRMSFFRERSVTRESMKARADVAAIKFSVSSSLSPSVAAWCALAMEESFCLIFLLKYIQIHIFDNYDLFIFCSMKILPSFVYLCEPH